MPDVEAYRRSYEQLYGELPSIPMANVQLEATLAPATSTVSRSSELHQVVEVTALLRGLGPSHRGCSVILRLQEEEG